MAEGTIDPEEFLDHLKSSGRVLHWLPLAPDDPRRPPVGEAVRTRESLEFLHHHWALPDSFDGAGAGSGLRGKVIGVVGRLTYRVLGRYLREERELLAHMVRVSDALERRCDELDQRCRQLADNAVNRQVAEAENQAILAAWLHAEPPAPPALRR